MNTATISSETLCPNGGARKADGSFAVRFRFPTGNTLPYQGGLDRAADSTGIGGNAER